MTIAITGLGLIGGSFAKAAARLGHRVLVENRTRATARLAVEEGVAAGILGEDGCSLAQCEIVIVCLPPELCAPWIENHSHEFAQGTVVCDVAGVKTPVCARLRKFALENRWTFIGAHPMAGREKGGYAQSVADLYCGASMVLTPYPASGRSPLDKLERFCRSIGFAQVVYTTPELHDLMIAYTSQLPHAISYAYSADPLKREAAGFTGGSFADMTRISASAPSLWAELIMENRNNFLKAADAFATRFDAIVSAVRAGDKTLLASTLEG